MTSKTTPARYNFRPTSADLEKIDAVAEAMRRAGRMFVTRSAAIRLALDIAVSPAKATTGGLAATSEVTL